MLQNLLDAGNAALTQAGAIIAAMDYDLAMHYLWPEVAALGLFLIGLDIIRRGRRIRMAEVAGLSFRRGGELAVICKTTDAQGQTHFARYNSLLLPPLATGTPLQVELNEEAGIASNPADYSGEVIGFFVALIALPYAWRDAQSDFHAVAVLTQLVVTQVLLAVLHFAFHPLDRFLNYRAKSGMISEAEDRVRYEDISNANGRLPALRKVLRARRRGAVFLLVAMGFALITFSDSLHELLEPPVAMVVSELKTEEIPFAMWNGAPRHEAEVYDAKLKPARQEPGRVIPYLHVYLGLTPPSFRAGETVYVRFGYGRDGVHLDEGPGVPLSQSLYVMLLAAAILIVAVKRWRADGRVLASLPATA